MYSGRGVWAAPKPSSQLSCGRFNKSPVIQQSHRSLSSQKPTELQDNAGKGDPVGWLPVHLHCGGETGVIRCRQVMRVFLSLRLLVVFQKRACGLQLLEKVCEHINLLERDYFALSFRDSDNNKVFRKRFFNGNKVSVYLES